MNHKLIKIFNKPRSKAITFWILFWALQSLLMSGGKHVGFYLQKNIAIVSLQAFVVYVNMYLLFPYLFEKRRYVLYTLSSVIFIYLIFSISFFFIGFIFSLSSIRAVIEGSYFSTDFWRILSGSSFYSLALVCSSIYKLLMINRNMESENLRIKNENKSEETLCIKEGNKSHFVSLSEILYIKGLREYVVWNTEKKKVISLESLKGIENKLGEKGFKRVHKSYIVNTKKISSLSTNKIKIGEEEIPIGRKYKHNIHGET